MKNKIFLIVLMGLSSLIYVSDSNAQNNKKSDRFAWVNLGVGQYAVSGSTDRSATAFTAYDGLLTFGITFSQQLNNHLFSVRILNSKELNIIFEPDDPQVSFLDMGVLYGRCLKMNNLRASASVGIGMVRFVDRGKLVSTRGGFSLGGNKYEKVVNKGIGIPLSGQIFIAAFDSFGIGLYAFANFNKYKSGSGFLLCLQFGRLR